MMKLLFIIIVLLAAVALVSAQAVPPGLGASTYTCLDRDGDGYGVGTGCLGPDADDTDVTVHSGPQVIAKYGTMTAFLNHLQYPATRIWYISTTGNDGTCAVNNVNLPCANFNARVRNNIEPGDVVIWRTGTYSQREDLISGTSGYPVVYMSYPGEAVNLALHNNL
jgi:hypothetical protein